MPPDTENLENEDGIEVPTEREPEEPSPFIRDMSEDDVYSRLQRVSEFPDHIGGLESRLNGGITQLQERLGGLEKSIGTRASFNTDKLKKILEEYDPKLAEALVPALAEAFQVAPLDEATLRPYLDPVSSKLNETFGQQLVLSFYPPEALGEIIPPVVNGKFAPEGQRHKDFVEWYSQQGYQTQQALLSFGAPYVNALRKFEAWEASRNQEKAAKAGSKANRLAQGQTPASRQKKDSAPQTSQEAFLAAFNEVIAGDS